MTTNADLATARDAALDRFRENLRTGRTFVLASNSHRSRYGYMAPITARQYGRILEAAGRMAAGGDRLAYAARTIVSRVSLYGDRAQACAAIWDGLFEATREDFYDVVEATGPEASRPSAHTHAWTLAQRALLQAWGNVLCDGLTDSTGGHGWALVAVAEEEGVTLPVAR